LKKKPRFVYTGIRVSNLERSIRFYKKVLGMKVSRRGKMPHGGKYVGLRSPKSEVELELNWYPKTSKFHTPFKRNETMDHLAFAVGSGNVKMAYQEFVEGGAKSAVSLEEAKGVCDPYVTDPDGNWIELLGWD
jgi:catechol 2,3-dioxygenase-like lactoylglutathione lyase family enzyme